MDKRRRTDNIFYRWGPLGAFVVLALVGAFAIHRSTEGDAERLRAAMVQSCERVNLLRQESNDRIESHTIERDVVLQIIATAQAIVRASETAGVRRQAGAIGQLSEQMRAVQFEPIEIVDCEKAIPRP